MNSSTLILFPFVSILCGVALLLLLGRWMSSRAKGALALIACLGAVGGVAGVYPAIRAGAALDWTAAAWDGPVSLAYHVDGLSLLFALMAVIIGAAVLLYATGYMAEEAGTTRFFVLMLVFIGGLVHLVYSANLLVFYASWEVIGLCSFLLVGFWYRQVDAVRGARKVLVMTHLAGYGLLAAILWLYVHSGVTTWTDPALSGAMTTGLFLLMLVAALAKSVQFPLHTWIPDAMAAPTPVSALLHAACYVKAGVYLVARLHCVGPWPDSWALSVVWIGTLTMAVGVLFAMVQTDLKRMLAFHTVSQIGYMMLGLGLGTPLGVAAGLLHCLNHGLFKGGLFLGAGAVQHATGTRDMNQLGGLARRMPHTAFFWLVSAGAIAGIPLLSGFTSKWLLYNAALEAGQPVPALVAWVVSTLTVFSFLKATSSVFLGAATPQTERAEEAPKSMLWGMGLLAAGSVLFGLAPQLPLHFLIDPLLPALGLAPAVGVTWLGLSTALGGWWSSGAVLLAVAAVGGGWLAYAILRPARAVVVSGGAAGWGGTFTGGEPLSGAGRLPASDFSAMIKNSLAPFYHDFDVDRYYLAAWRGLRALAEAAGKASAWLERRALGLLLALAPLLALGAYALAPGASIPLEGEGAARLPLLLPLAVGLAWLALACAAWCIPENRRSLPLLVLSG
ncbi:MAG: NADH-quinone oxidoreductase subunit L, partial [Anaerolineaceae bacterium]|nr:NADH-quinone oxidoreductase subunit L [Anaerolineaceae bacterium]